MLLVILLTLAMLASLARGGSLRHLAAVRLRGTAYIAAAFAIQFAFYSTPLRHSAAAARWGSGIYLVAIGLGALGALRNWRLGAAVRLATAGVLLNAAVIALNGGHMPVDAAAMRAAQGAAKVREIATTSLYNNTRLAGPATRAAALSDVIPVRVPLWGGNVYSVGDILLIAGLAMFAYRAARRPPDPDAARPIPSMP